MGRIESSMGRSPHSPFSIFHSRSVNNSCAFVEKSTLIHMEMFNVC